VSAFTEAERLTRLRAVWPCTPQRHTFDCDVTACLCGVLSRGRTTPTPEVVLYWPTVSNPIPDSSVEEGARHD
jgi:hypothetical protein